MRRLDNAPAAQTVRLLVYGPTGTGKTTLGVTAPKPLILLTEEQGMFHIREAAARAEVPTPPVLRPDSLADVGAVYKALKRARKGERFTIPGDGEPLVDLPEPPETIVVDSLTGLSQMVMAEIEKVSPPETGKDGLPERSFRHWGAAGDRLQNLILSFRDLPYHVLFLALPKEGEEGEGTSRMRTSQPDVGMRKLGSFAAAAVNAVGYSYRREVVEGGKVRSQFACMFSAPEGIMSKRCAPLRERERMDASVWIKAMLTAVAPSGSLPQPSAESLAVDQAEAEKAESQPEPAKRQRRRKEAQDA